VFNFASVQKILLNAATYYITRNARRGGSAAFIRAFVAIQSFAVFAGPFAAFAVFSFVV